MIKIENREADREGNKGLEAITWLHSAAKYIFFTFSFALTRRVSRA